MTGEPDPNAARLEAIDADHLTPIVRKLLGQPEARVTDWQYERLRGGFGGGRGGTFLYRFTGDADARNRRLSWHLILKVIAEQPDDDPAGTHYWKREIEFFRSGLADGLSEQFHAANVIAIEEFPGESGWLWQELLEESVGALWPMDVYAQAARHLGQFNGNVAQRPLPQASWLSTGWLRRRAELIAGFLPQIQAMLTRLSTSGVYPVDALEQFMRFWDERERFLNTLDRLPQAFCHQDPVRMNLFARHRDDGNLETVAVDWAYAGIGPVGMDIAVPFTVDLAFLMVDAQQVGIFADSLLRGYEVGLRDAGYDGDAQRIRLGFIAAAACKYLEMVTMAALAGLDDPAKVSFWEETIQRPHPDVVRQYAQHFVYAMAHVDEARGLMSRFGY